MPRLLLVALGSLLVGCASKIVVKNTNEISGRADYPGVFYVLPKSRIVAQIDLTTSTFTPGELADLVSDNDVERLALNPATPASWGTCTGDAPGKKQYRYKLADVSSFAVTGVPDSSNVYYVRMKPEQFQKLTVGLNTRADGVVGEVSATSTNLSAAIVRGLAGEVVDIFGADEDTVEADEDVAADEDVEVDEDTDGDGDTESALKRAAMQHRSNNAIRELDRIEGRITYLLYSSGNPANMEAVFERLEARRKELRELFTGKLSKETKALTLTWIPDAQDVGATTGICCKAVEATSCKVGDANSTKFRLPCELEACNTVTVNHLYLRLTEPADSDTIRKDLLAVDYLRNKSSAERGFAYRVPAAVDVEFAIEMGDDDKELGRYQTYIAQFGQVMYLPSNIGSSKSEFTVSFHEELGALKSVSAGGVGVDSDDTLSTLQDFTRDDELTRLERQYKILDYKQKIDDLQEGDDDSEEE